MAADKIIVGLGNPGTQYAKTRHNAGAMVLEALAKSYGAAWHTSRQAEALTASIVEEGAKILLVRPTTYMNDSGQAVGGIVKFEKIRPASLLVICDDIRLDVGQIRLKLEGSDGGHNGLRSIIAHLGGNTFPRLRVGVGEPRTKDIQAEYVLSNFRPEEKAVIAEVVERAVECCRMWLRDETSRAMTVFNKRKENKDHE